MLLLIWSGHPLTLCWMVCVSLRLSFVFWFPSWRRCWLSSCPLQIVLPRWYSQSLFLSLTSDMTLSPLQLRLIDDHLYMFWGVVILQCFINQLVGYCAISIGRSSEITVRSLLFPFSSRMIWLIALVCSKQPENPGTPPFCTDVSVYWSAVRNVVIRSTKRFFGIRSHVSTPSP